MILPYSASIGREMISLVPSDLKEAALSLGATPSETIWRVTLPYARSGILGGVLLSLGRALGETMAVTMVIGNSNVSYLQRPGSRQHDGERDCQRVLGGVQQRVPGSLIEIALLLFVISTLINIAGKIVVNRMAAGVR